MKRTHLLWMLSIMLFSCLQKNEPRDTNTPQITIDKDSILQQISTLNGIWIAEDYYNSFEKTQSAVASKSAFFLYDPVALRINSREIKNGILNIGYAIPHDHMLHPEVSKYIVIDNDTIHEQGHFEINLFFPDSLNYYKTSEIYYFNYEWESYMKWNVSDTSIIFYRPPNEQHKEKTIKYVKVKDGFEENYLYPNPLYYYVRSKTLVGNYILKDSVGNTLTKQLQIRENGVITGYEEFENLIACFSTDVYCGPETFIDYVLFCENLPNPDADCKGYSYKRKNNTTIELFTGSWYYVDRKETNTLNKVFTLIKL